MPEHDKPTSHRDAGRIARAWNAYGERVRGQETLRALLTRAIVRPIVAAAMFLVVGVATGALPVGEALGEDIDNVLGDRLSGTLGASPSNPVDGKIRPGTGEPLPPKQARAIAKAVDESRRALIVETLVRDNDCYTSSAPAPDTVPTWSVVTLPGEDPALLPSAVGFGVWMEGDPGELHAFCP